MMSSFVYRCEFPAAPADASAMAVNGGDAPELNTQSRWYHISDSRVKEVSEGAVLNSQAYLLFYERTR